MDFAPGSDLKLLRKAIREFAEDIVAPQAGIMEDTGRMPPELPGVLAAQGLFGVCLPFACGGTRMTSLERLVTLEEVARISPAAAVYLAAQHTAAAAVLEGAREKADILPDLAAGRRTAALALSSGSPGLTCRITGDGSHRLDGNTAWCQGDAQPAFFLVEARDAPGVPALFILPHPTAGVHYGRLSSAGLRGSQAGPLVLSAACLPPASRLAGFRAGPAGDPVAAVHVLGFAACALGVMQAALDAGLDFARKRVLYGKAIAHLQAVQFRLADMFADLEAGRLMAYQAASRFDQDKATPLDLYALHRFLKSAAVRNCRKAVEIFGGYGALKDFSAERCLRDAQALAAGGFPGFTPSGPGPLGPVLVPPASPFLL